MADAGLIRQAVGVLTDTMTRLSSGIDVSVSTVANSTADLVSRMADGQTGASIYNRQVKDWVLN